MQIKENEDNTMPADNMSPYIAWSSGWPRSTQTLLALCDGNPPATIGFRKLEK